MIRLELEIIDYASETEEEIAEKAVELLKAYRAEIPVNIINKTVYSPEEEDTLIEELIEKKFKPIKQEVTKLAETELTKIQEVTAEVLAKMQEFREALQQAHKGGESDVQATEDIEIEIIEVEEGEN